jgi:hypothetical protein
MTSATRIAVLGLAALLFTSAAAQAGGLDGINDAVDTDQAQDAGDNLLDAIDTDEARDVDANLHDKIVFLNNEDLNRAMIGPDSVLDVKLALASGLLKLTCIVDDSSLVIANTGRIAIPAQTKLRWTVAAIDEAGTLKLASGLAVGARARTTDLVAGADGEACAIKVLGH